MTRRGAWVLGAGLGAALLVVAAIVIWQSTHTPTSAEDTARAYVHAWESGDPDGIESTARGIPDEALAAFGAADDLITEGAVDDVDVRGDAATAQVSFRLGGDRHSATLMLTQQDDGWRIESSSALGRVDAAVTRGSFIVIGDAAVAADDPVALLPAVYTVAAAPAELLDGSATATVLPGETASLEIDVALRPAATAAAQSALDEHLERCTAEGGDQPEACGIRIPWGTEFRAVSDVAYRVESLPTLTLTDTGFTAADGVLTATVAGTGQDGATRSTTYRTDAWLVRGGITFTATDISLDVW